MPPGRRDDGSRGPAGRRPRTPRRQPPTPGGGGGGSSSSCLVTAVCLLGGLGSLAWLLVESIRQLV